MLKTTSIFLTCGLLLGSYISAAPATEQNAANKNATALTDEQKTASKQAADAWLKIVDQGNYAGSWNAAAPTLKMIMPQDQWVTFIQAMRQPLGSLNSRELALQAPAENPKGLAPGEYMVQAYKSSFSGNQNAQELVTLSLGPDGQWRVLSYFVK